MTTIPFPTSRGAHRDGGPGQTTLVLPVAARAFSHIRFDPVGDRARAVPPAGALNWLEENLRQGVEIRAVDLDGPGDPLCEIGATMETLDLIHRRYPGLALSLTTLGFHAAKFAASLAKSGVQSVTLLVDAVQQEIADRLYAWIRPDKKTIPLAQATAMLIVEQQLAVTAFREAGCRVTVRSTVYPGFNDDHVEEIARVMATMGAEAMTLVPCKNTANGEEPLLPPPEAETLQRLRESAAKHLATFLAAEKANRIGLDCSSPLGACKSIATIQAGPTKRQPNVAVVSSNGMEVDLHLGQAYRVLIYGPRQDGLVCLLGTRPVPEPGSGNSRWDELAETLTDCFAILAASAGESPRRILGRHGITVLITGSEIEGAVDLLYGGGPKGKKGRR